VVPSNTFTISEAADCDTTNFASTFVDPIETFVPFVYIIEFANLVDDI